MGVVEVLGVALCFQFWSPHILEYILFFINILHFLLSLNIHDFFRLEPKIILKLVLNSKDVTASANEMNVLKPLFMFYFIVKQIKEGTEYNYFIDGAIVIL